ncbi:MAG TPA: hypothetical protein PK280_02635 [Planctomycetota bacterium]|nr:hypothetical protein [Planctomycetota bacterium]
MKARLAIALLVLCPGLLAAEPAAPAFAAKPTVAKAGDGAKIAFAVATPTDVEVAVLDAKGAVVRHLVAGAIGGKDPSAGSGPAGAPPAPLKAGLAQELEWDGRDDAGKPAAGGPFKVRVRAGMRPEPDGFVLENPASTGPVKFLAVGPKGSIYAFHYDPTTVGHWGSIKLKVLNRDGKHERTIMPFSGELPAERLKAMGVFQDAAGNIVPHVYHTLRLSVYPELVWRAAGQSPAVDSKGRVHWVVMGPAIASLDADGGAPYDSVVGPKLLAEIPGLNLANGYQLSVSRPALALSTDEQHLYLSGLTAGDPKNKSVAGVPCVFRIDLKTRAKAEPFLGKVGSPGKEKDLVTSPRGVAVAGGLIYVADHGADRVAIFNEKDGSPAGEIKVKAPDSLGVDPADGSVYVCSMADVKTPDLIKFDKSGKELCKIALPNCRHAEDCALPHRIAVDASAKPVRIVMPTIPYSSAPTLLVIEDAGGKFEMKGDPRDVKTPWAEGPRDISVDRVRGELYVKSHVEKWWRLDEKSGKVLDDLRLQGMSNNPNLGTQLVADPEGNLVSYSWSYHGLHRFDHAGKALNWPGQASNYLPVPGLMCFQLRNLALLRPDELYIIPPRVWKQGKDASNPPTNDNTTSVNVMGPDGKVKRTVVWQCYKGDIIRLDAKGNIYLASMVKPEGRHWPEFFDGKIKPPPAATGEHSDSFYYSYMYGSIVKFPPEGGAIWYRKDVSEGVEGTPPAELLAKPKVKASAHDGYKTMVPAELQGALWSRFGFAPYSATSASCMLTCMCEGGGFDVDAYGRVFFPNLGLFRAEVLDTAGNPIATFGKYGNQDDGAKGSGAKKPEVPLAWPLTVAVSETHAYVADTVSRRVARVKLAFAAEELAEIK